MATLSDLRSAVEGILNLPAAGALLQLNANTRERAFEAYVFALLVQAVRRAGGTATVRGIQSGPSPSIVVLRGGPGRLGSRSQNYAYVDCSLQSQQFEIHVDVQYEGTSGAVHEVDVSIYDHDMADRVRLNQNEFAKCSKLYGVFECKFYDDKLGTVLGRTFVGLLSDCGKTRMKAFCSNGAAPNLAKYFSPQQRPDYFLQLSPLRAAVEQRFIDFFDQQLRRWAGVV